MPYSSASDAPDYVPKAKKKQWVAVWNSAYGRAKKEGKSDKEAESSAFAQANGVAGPNSAKKFAKLLAKVTDEEARAFANALIAQIEAEWTNLPLEVEPALESAVLSGIGQGALQIEFSNAGMIASANDAAHEYAMNRAAEMVGMKRDAEGNLIPNPDARWAISDTTREKIQEIISDAFTEETTIDEIESAIQEALEEEATNNGIFSDARAALIAQTEISNAQAGGNYSVWQQSGVVRKVQWLTAEDEHVCPVCEDNDGVSVELGRPFPSGDLYPGAHPRCRCVIIVSEVGQAA